MVPSTSSTTSTVAEPGSGETVGENPPTHEDATSRVWYLRTADSSDGEVHEQRVEYLPGSPFPPTHHHPEQDEHFEVEAGAMLFVVAGEERRVAAGEVIDIPRGTPHRARNASGSASAVVRWETRPALRTTEFFTTAARLGDERSVLDAALLAATYRDVFRLTGPTALLVPVLAQAARLRGRRLPPPQ
jgi:mannose-6-phosphate isomerase-like protein (cupin superfamily)